MTPTETAQVMADLKERVQAIRATVNKPLVAILKFGGYGDFYLLLTLGKAAQRKFGERAHIVLVGLYTRSTPDVDLCNMVADDTDVIRLPMMPHDPILDVLRETCEVVYHVPGYSVKRYTQAGWDDAGQAEADAGLAKWADLYYGFPMSQHTFQDVSQWTVLAESSALDVTPEDIGPCPLRMRKLDPDRVTLAMLVEKSSSSVERARIHDVRFVVVCNQAGRGGRLKQMPPPVMDAIVAALRDCGLRAMQLGAHGEPKIKGVIDRRGYRWPIQCGLMALSEGYVGIEGGMAFAAWGARVRTLLVTGGTPFKVFAFPGATEMKAPVCTPCWWHSDPWDTCPRGFAHCANFPTAEEARAIILREFGQGSKKQGVA